MKVGQDNNVLRQFSGYSSVATVAARRQGGPNSNVYVDFDQKNNNNTDGDYSEKLFNEPAIGPSVNTAGVNPNALDPKDRVSYVGHAGCTPYKSPAFLSYFRIYKVKKFTLKPGETKVLKQTVSKKLIPCLMEMKK